RFRTHERRRVRCTIGARLTGSTGRLETPPIRVSSWAMTQKGVDDMKKHRLYLALLFSLTLWASSFPGIKAILDGYSPFAVAVLRFLIASLILAGLAPRVNVRPPRPPGVPLSPG